MSREAAINALFAKLQGAAAFKTASRRVKLWSDVNQSDRPALFLMETGETNHRGGVPPKTTLNLKIFIYIDAGKDPNAVPATTINTLLDAIDAAIKPDVLTELQPLGGTAYNCWIDGETVKDPGDLDGDGIAIIPIKITLP